jgi:class 3 adenylate cyclase
VAVLCGRRREAEALAERAERICASGLAAGDATERYWLLATLAEAALVRGRLEEACRRYAEAAATTPDDLRSIVGSRRNARLLADHLRLPWTPIAAALPLPRVAVFSGHMIDAPGRARPRFPPALEPAVRAAIEARLDALGRVVCYASAACGSDLLFLESALRRGHKVVVVLPYEVAGFRRDSVELYPGTGWGERFEAVLARAQVVPPVSNQRSTWGGAYYAFANEVLLGLAMLRAQQLETAVVGLAVWDGRAGDGPGGTAATVDLWRRLGVPTDWIDLHALRTGAAPRRRMPAPKRRRRTIRNDAGRVRALLFADVKDFSRIPEEIARTFVTHALGLAGRLVRRPDLRPVGREPQGDGFHLVFATARAAGRFAVALSERLAATDWSRHRLPPDLVMRIGLHAGVVFRMRDPVAGRLVHIGTHIVRAARIEAVTPPGQVWASQEFAALAALERVREFACEYVGQVPLAKRYGVFPLYRVRSKRRPGRV